MNRLEAIQLYWKGFAIMRRSYVYDPTRPGFEESMAIDMLDEEEGWKIACYEAYPFFRHCTSQPIKDCAIPLLTDSTASSIPYSKSSCP